MMKTLILRFFVSKFEIQIFLILVYIMCFQGNLTEEKIEFEKYRVKILGEIADKQNQVAHQSRILINEQEKWKTEKQQVKIKKTCSIKL